MSEIISILSGKGGVGKTFTAANLSLAMQDLGEQVVCIDTDINSPNLAIQLGYKPKDYTLEDFLKDEVNPLKAISIHESGLMFVPPSLHLTDQGISQDKLEDMIEKFSGFGDRIIIDTPPGFKEGVEEVLKVSDRSLIVTNPEIQALQDAQKIVNKASKQSSKVEGIVLNKTEDIFEEIREGEVEKFTDSEILLKVPYTKEVRKSIYKNKPVVLDRHSEVGMKFKELAAKLSDKDFERPWYAGFGRFLKKLVRV